MNITVETLKSLGIDPDAIEEKIIDAAVERLLFSVGHDEDGRMYPGSSAFKKKMEEKIKDRVDAGVAALCEQHVLPNVGQYLEQIVIQKTNSYGEKDGQPIPFIEYLVKRADDYLREPVDLNGKTRAEDSYNWRQHSTRAAHLVDKHIQFHIETAMKQAIANANASIVGGLANAVKVALAEVGNKLKVEVKTK